MSEIPKPSRTETTMDDLLNALVGANDDGTLDGLGKPLNVCDHCKKEISPGERCWMTTLAEITADSKVFFPSAYDIKYPLVYWLFTWLKDELGVIEWALLMLKLVQEIGDGKDPLLAVAAAVVKVGKPKSKVITITGPAKPCACGSTEIRHHLLDNGSMEIQCAKCHAPSDAIPGPQDPPRPKKRKRYA